MPDGYCQDANCHCNSWRKETTKPAVEKSLTDKEIHELESCCSGKSYGQKLFLRALRELLALRRENAEQVEDDRKLQAALATLAGRRDFHGWPEALDLIGREITQLRGMVAGLAEALNSWLTRCNCDSCIRSRSHASRAVLTPEVRAVAEAARKDTK